MRSAAPYPTLSLSQKAVEFLQCRDFTAGANYYSEKSKEDPKNFIYLAFFLNLAGDKAAAYAEFNGAVILLAEHHKPELDAYGHLFKRYGMYDLAYRAFQSVDNHKEAALAALKWGKPKVAREHYEKLNIVFEQPRAAKYLEEGSACSKQYFFALFQTNKTIRMTNFEEVFKSQYAETNLKMLAALALAELDETYFEKFKAFYELEFTNFYPQINDVETNCIYALATRHIHKTLQAKNADDLVLAKYKKILRNLLTSSPIAHNVLLPFAVPLYLRTAFTQIQLDSQYWPAKVLVLEDTHELDLIKEQYHELVILGDAGGLDKRTRYELAMQGLCSQTTIGNVINISQGTMRKTDYSRGRKSKFIQYLKDNYTIDELVCPLSASTIIALEQHSKNDATFLTAVDQDLTIVIRKLLDSTISNTPAYESSKHLIATKLQPILSSVAEHMHDLAKKNYEKVVAEIEASDVIDIPCVQRKAYIGDFFYAQGCYRLAHLAYSSYVSSLPQGLVSLRSAYHPDFYKRYMELTLQQALNAIKVSFVMSDFETAKLYLHCFNRHPAFGEVYRTLAKEQAQAAYKLAFQFEPMGLQLIEKLPTLVVNDSADLLARAKRLTWNLPGKFAQAEYYLRSGNLIAAQETFELIRCEYHLAQTRLGPISDQDFYLKAIFYLGHIALLGNEFEKATQLFANYETLAPKLGIEYWVDKITLLLQTKRFDLVQSMLLGVEKDLSPTHLLILHTLIARFERSHIPVLEAHLAALPCSPQPTPIENVARMCAYKVLGKANEIKALLDHSNISPQFLLINELDFLQKSYLEILVREKYFSDTQPQLMNQDDLKLIKESYVGLFVRSKNLDLAFQALCPSTRIGKIFATARRFTRTSFTTASSSLKGMLDELDKILKEHSTQNFEFDLLPSTRKAMVHLFETDPGIFAAIYTTHNFVYETFIKCKMHFDQRLFATGPGGQASVAQDKKTLTKTTSI